LTYILPFKLIKNFEKKNYKKKFTLDLSTYFKIFKPYIQLHTDLQKNSVTQKFIDV